MFELVYETLFWSWWFVILKLMFIIINKPQIVLLACVAIALGDVSHLDTVVRFDSVVNPDSYQYAYETSKGIKAEESGSLKNAGSENEAIEAKGSYCKFNEMNY